MTDEQLTIFEMEEEKEMVVEQGINQEVEEVIETAVVEEDESYTEEVLPYQVGDIVRINLTITPDEDPETYYYLEGFVKKKGMIKEIILEPRLQYRVLFGDHLIYLYHEEIL